MRDRSMIVMPESGPACGMPSSPFAAGTPSIAHTGGRSQSRSGRLGSAAVPAACGPEARGPDRGSVTLALEPLAQHLAMPSHRLGLFAGATFRGLFVRPPSLHFPKRALALHLLLQHAEG